MTATGWKDNGCWPDYSLLPLFCTIGAEVDGCGVIGNGGANAVSVGYFRLCLVCEDLACYRLLFPVVW